MKVLQYGDTSRFFREASYVFMIPAFDNNFTRILAGSRETCKWNQLSQGHFHEIISISR